MVCKNSEILKSVWKVSLKDTHKNPCFNLRTSWTDWIFLLIFFNRSGSFHIIWKVCKQSEYRRNFPKISIVFNLKTFWNDWKSYLCFPEIIDFSRKFKESRTNLNVSKLFKNTSDTKKNQVLLGLFQKNSLKSIDWC